MLWCAWPWALPRSRWAAGCVFTDWGLRRSVVTQASTLTELQYQQVLGNLAMMSLDPDAVPTHINIRDGSAQIQDNGVISSASPASLYPSLSGSRTVVVAVDHDSAHR